MNWLDKIVLVLWMAAVVVAQARYQAYEIHRNVTFSHWGKGAIYGLLMVPAVVGLFLWRHEWYVKEVAVYGITFRQAFFDPILNAFIPRPFWYNSTTAEPKASLWTWIKQRRSALDWLENRMSVTWIRIFKISYIILFLILIWKWK